MDYNSLQDNSKQFFLNKYLSPSNDLRKQCKSLKSFAMESKYNDYCVKNRGTWIQKPIKVFKAMRKNNQLFEHSFQRW